MIAFLLLVDCDGAFRATLERRVGQLYAKRWSFRKGWAVTASCRGAFEHGLRLAASSILPDVAGGSLPPGTGEGTPGVRPVCKHLVFICGSLRQTGSLAPRQARMPAATGAVSYTSSNAGCRFLRINLRTVSMAVDLRGVRRDTAAPWWPCFAWIMAPESARGVAVGQSGSTAVSRTTKPGAIAPGHVGLVMLSNAAYSAGLAASRLADHSRVCVWPSRSKAMLPVMLSPATLPV